MNPVSNKAPIYTNSTQIRSYFMGDHLVMFMDQLLTESALDASIASKTSSQLPVLSPGRDITISFSKIDFDSGSSPSNLAECRICHDEDAESNMETPCSCSGSLKYAHRKCVQRWCSEKGDTICEICHQQFRPGYTSPPPLFINGGMPLNFRGNWESSRRHLLSPQYLGMLATDDYDFDSDFDEYSPSSPSPTSLMCCRIVAVILIILLVLRHILPVVLSEAGEYSLTLFTLLILRTVGIVLPVCFIFRTVIGICHRRNHQDPWVSLVASSSDEENDLRHPRSRTVRVQ